MPKGKRRVDIEYLENERARQVTLNKRKYGLFKKAQELAILCGCEIGIIIYDWKDRSYLYSSKSISDTLTRLAKDQAAPLDAHDSATMAKLIEKREGAVRKSNGKRSHDNSDDEDLDDNLTVDTSVPANPEVQRAAFSAVERLDSHGSTASGASLTVQTNIPDATMKQASMPKPLSALNDFASTIQIKQPVTKKPKSFREADLHLPLGPSTDSTFQTNANTFPSNPGLPDYNLATPRAVFNSPNFAHGAFSSDSAGDLLLSTSFLSTLNVGFTPEVNTDITASATNLKSAQHKHLESQFAGALNSAETKPGETGAATANLSPTSLVQLKTPDMMKLREVVNTLDSTPSLTTPNLSTPNLSGILTGRTISATDLEGIDALARLSSGDTAELAAIATSRTNALARQQDAAETSD
ncbi:uncharacterized protein MONBRDRAFT_37624 [Monosiga brevicollis MX1]|uniref:MADS-box domain-containing protein n=1 Tax=Monosiga brevicollis TaxID=81824 RepID=A9V2W6_MONBE|nr:uncharacterized protein MONBRDRAFT_37624 [Monosiga brevicollis MX1]EDQ87957.1 predicted protein [Monosiga brevicollis MX1]|eukprot:XP_001747033.1 hypothetical protein [Monosiga brevicollis MX1]